MRSNLANGDMKMQIAPIDLKKLALTIIISLFFSSCFAAKDKTQTLLNNFRIQSHAPAAVLAINLPDKHISTFVSGTTEKKTTDNPNPPLVTAANLFQIGSITKSFTAVIILQ